MCLIVFAYKVHKKFPLILAGNRDEFYRRPARSARFWDEKPGILAGKDLEAGGTWLGVSKAGKIAALTNYRDLDSIKNSAPSRGNIVINFLATEHTTHDYLESLSENASLYNGFNLLAGNADRLYYYSNQKKGYEEVPPGYHAISNAFLNSKWPKTENALAQFRDSVEKRDIEEDRIFDLLTDTTRYPDHQLPSTGLPLPLERAVSSIFIQTKDYGTRCSTLFLTSTDREFRFTEKTYHTGTTDVNETVQYSFTADSLKDKAK